MPCKIINNSGLEISGFEDMIRSLVDFSQNRFGFENPPSIFLNSDSDNAANPLGKTAYYDPQQVEIHVYTDGRHPKDIMRSISHELIHHKQNGEGNLQGNHYSGEGYAQKDPHMRKMEKEAYLQGNMCFRDWEDGYKQKQQVYNEWRTNTMSLKEWKNKELFGLLSQKWGFGKNVVTEAKGEKGDADPLDGEREKFDKDLDGVPDGGDKDPDDPDIQEGLKEEETGSRLADKVAAKLKKDGVKYTREKEDEIIGKIRKALEEMGQFKRGLMNDDDFISDVLSGLEKEKSDNLNESRLRKVIRKQIREIIKNGK